MAIFPPVLKITMPSVIISNSLPINAAVPDGGVIVDTPVVPVNSMIDVVGAIVDAEATTVLVKSWIVCQVFICVQAWPIPFSWAMVNILFPLSAILPVPELKYAISLLVVVLLLRVGIPVPDPTSGIELVTVVADAAIGTCVAVIPDRPPAAQPTLVIVAPDVG